MCGETIYLTISGLAPFFSPICHLTGVIYESGSKIGGIHEDAGRLLPHENKNTWYNVVPK